MHWLRLAIVAAILLASPDALAVQPDEILKDQRRRRARANRQSSCVAWCAKTSRSTIRMRRLRATCASWCASACRPATSNQQALDFLVQRYGEFVLLRPRPHGEPRCSGWRRPCC